MTAEELDDVADNLTISGDSIFRWWAKLHRAGKLSPGQRRRVAQLAKRAGVLLRDMVRFNRENPDLPDRP